VEGGDAQPLALLALEQLADPLPHLARGLVGEGHRSDMARADAAVLNQMGDLLRNNARFTRARTGQYQQGAVDVAHRFFLSGIEVGHDKKRLDLDGGVV
jgi:hypothetical protein